MCRELFPGIFCLITRKQFKEFILNKLLRPTIATLILTLAIFSILPVNSHEVRVYCEPCITPPDCNCPESYTIHISLLSAILQWKFRFLRNIDFETITAAGLITAYFLSAVIRFLWKRISVHKKQTVKEGLKASRGKLRLK
jgi:hypothetical protein